MKNISPYIPRWPRHHAVLFVALVTLGATLVAFLCYRGGPVPERWEILLDDTHYEIRFNGSPYARFPHINHTRLAESPAFLERLGVRFPAGTVLNEHFTLNDMGGRFGPVVIRVIRESPEEAANDLRIWAEEYIRVVPVHRAGKLLEDLRAETTGLRKSEYERRGVHRQLSSFAAEPDQGRGYDELPLESLNAKRAALAAEQQEDELRLALHEAIITRLERMTECETLEEYVELWADRSEASEAALSMVRIGLTDLLSAPVFQKSLDRTAARILTVSLAAFVLSSLIGIVLVRSGSGREMGAKA